MDIAAQSIYLDPTSLDHHSPKEYVSIFASELATCERLLVMGYKYSNHTDLAKRAEWLEKEIDRWEKLLKLRVFSLLL